MTRDKIIWINNLKGLAILAVVLGHIDTPLTQFIFSWHIPLFFFLSGLTIKTDVNIFAAIKKDFYRLVIPFIIFGLLGLSAEYLKRWLWPGFQFINGRINFHDELLGIFWWMDITHLHHYGFVLWFLPALFWTKTIYLVLMSVLKNKYILIIVSLIPLYVFANQVPVMPFAIDKALISLSWFSLGNLISGNNWQPALLAMLLAPFPSTNIAVKTISLYGFIYSLGAIYVLVGLFKQFTRPLSLFGDFGRHTLLILVTHPYLNNFAYFFVILVLKLNWLVEIIVILGMVLAGLKLYEKNKPS